VCGYLPATAGSPQAERARKTGEKPVCQPGLSTRKRHAQFLDGSKSYVTAKMYSMHKAVQRGGRHRDLYQPGMPQRCPLPRPCRIRRRSQSGRAMVLFAAAVCVFCVTAGAVLGRLITLPAKAPP
jgi:hypothetical protein